MAVTADDYLLAMQGLLPPGAAWSKDPDAYTTRLLGGLAQEMARVDGRTAGLLEEADPRTTAELFADWERVAGLPDDCVTAFAGTQTVDQRRAALVGRLATLGGQSRAYYIALAASLGYTVSITEFVPHTVDSTVDDPLYDTPWTYAWQVNAPLNTITYADVDSTVDEPLASWGSSLLECVLARVRPAHTTLIFAYT